MRREHTAEFLALEPFLRADVPPEKLLRRNGQAIWRVRKTAVDFTRDSVASDWALVRAPSELVRIPLIPYRTNTLDPAEFGLSVFDMAARLFLDFSSAVRVHTVFGTPVEDLQPEIAAFRYWIGVAVQLH